MHTIDPYFFKPQWFFDKMDLKGHFSIHFLAKKKKLLKFFWTIVCRKQDKVCQKDENQSILHIQVYPYWTQKININHKFYAWCCWIFIICCWWFMRKFKPDLLYYYSYVPWIRHHRRRINTEEKAKIVAAVWGTDVIQFFATLAILDQGVWKNWMN